MAETKAAVNPGKVVTGKVRLSYLKVFKPEAGPDGGEPKYSTALLIPKSDKETVSKIQKAIEHAKTEGKSKWNGKIPANLKNPLRDGDLEREDDENYAGHYFINAKSSNRPGLVDRALNQITDESDLYSGCYARVSLTFYPYAAKGNNGVAAGLNHIQKLSDGEPMGSRTRAEDEFDAVEDDLFD